MRQVVQNVRTGATTVEELPTPFAPPNGVLIATAASLVSAGTERYVVELARKSLIGKARERPDQVRRVLQKLRQEGLRATATQVRAKLDEPMALGYSLAGVVLDCGIGVQELKPGDRVAAAASHADIAAISKNLCASIPENVTFEQAAYAGVGAIALEGVRLARVSLGERVLVIGLGLIGQMTVGLLKAQGCRVMGVDIDAAKLDLAKAFGADDVAVGTPRDAINAFSGGNGVDAVVITAATQSNEPIEVAADVTRSRGRIVLVGVTGLNIPRPPFFAKELEFTVSSSVGPGRTDTTYEDKGVDYPFGHVRWTAQRNIAAVLDVIAMGKLPVEKLTTHRFPIERASAAYDVITSKSEPFFGVVLEYAEPHERRLKRRLDLPRSPRARGGRLGLSVIGAGNFIRLVMMPLIGKSDVTLRGLCSAKGLNARTTGEHYDFRYATTDVGELLSDADTNAIFVATRHDLHAELVVKCLRAGKNVFVEKPLCIRTEELTAIDACVRELGEKCPVLMVGFNRRFAPATKIVRSHFDRRTPRVVSYRFAPGPIPKEAWPQDMDVGGGRIIGEACHAIDTATSIIDSPPCSVFASSVGMVGSQQTTDDRVSIVLGHEDGSSSTVLYDAGGDRGGPIERIEVFGGGRTAVVDEWNQIELWQNGSVTKRKGDKDKGHAAEIEEFLTACRRGGEWPIPWEHLYGVTWASLMAVLSLREGIVVRMGVD
jgi:predicted dehydrogenase